MNQGKRRCQDEIIDDGLISCHNEYCGTKTVPFQIKRISVGAINNKEMFENYVKSRCPILFEDHIKDNNFKCKEWTNQYLIDYAGI